MSARKRVILGGGERLIMVGHELAIVVDDGTIPGVYFAEDWNAVTAPSAEIDLNGDVAFLDGFGNRVNWVRPREARCPSELARFERLFARDFKDSHRVQP